MADTHFVLTKLFGVLTAGEFVVAMRYYFQRKGSHLSLAYRWVFCAIVAMAIHLWGLLNATSTPEPLVWLAFGFFLLANSLFWTAIVAHGQSRPNAAFAAVTPESLTVTGPYRYIRHPFYLAYICGFLGSSCIGYRWTLFATTVIVFLAYNYAAIIEEKLLATPGSKTGDEYLLYLKSTWRWVPFIW